MLCFENFLFLAHISTTTRLSAVGEDRINSQIVCVMYGAGICELWFISIISTYSFMAVRNENYVSGA